MKVCPIELTAKVHHIETYLNVDKEPEPEVVQPVIPKKVGDNSPSLKKRRGSVQTSWANVRLE